MKILLEQLFGTHLGSQSPCWQFGLVHLLHSYCYKSPVGCVVSGGSKCTSAKDDQGSVAITCPYDAFSQATYPRFGAEVFLRVNYFLCLVKKIIFYQTVSPPHGNIPSAIDISCRHMSRERHRIGKHTRHVPWLYVRPFVYLCWYRVAALATVTRLDLVVL